MKRFPNIRTMYFISKIRFFFSIVFLSFAVHASAQQTKPVPVVGFIGDSITHNGATVSAAGQHLSALYGQPITVLNKGLSGRTTKSWLPDGAEQLLIPAEADFRSAGVNAVSIMLGTNDAKVGDHIPAEMYRHNLETTIAHLFSNIPTLRVVVLNDPITPNRSYAGYPGLINSPTSGYTRIEEYHAQLKLMVNKSTIIHGDTGMYSYFTQHPEEVPDSIHPQGIGTTHLGNAWANAIYKAMNATTGPVPPATFTPVPTAAPTRIPTLTHTPVPTNTVAPTRTPTSTPIKTATPTHTPIPTKTAVPPPTATRTPVPTFTPTKKPTSTPTRTPIATATLTPIPTSTRTSIPTRIPTQLPTVRPTTAPTLTPTLNPTVVNTIPSPPSTPIPLPTGTPIQLSTPSVTSTPLTNPIERPILPSIFDIAGVVLSDSGPLPDVIINGGMLGTRRTDRNGRFVFQRISSATNYDLIPQRTGYVFNSEIIYSSSAVDPRAIVITGVKQDKIEQFQCTSKIISARIVQTDRISSRLKTDADKLLSLFAQNTSSSEKKYRQFKESIDTTYFKLIRWYSFALPQEVLSCKDARCSAKNTERTRVKYLSAMVRLKTVSDKIAQAVNTNHPTASARSKAQMLQRNIQKSLMDGKTQLKVMTVKTYVCS